ncbi:MAG: beta-glucosidase [Pseudomonadota bacterium]
MKIHSVFLASIVATCAFLPAVHADGAKPWMNPSLDPDTRAKLVVTQMTRKEKQTLVFAFFATDAPWKKFAADPAARAGSAGYVPAIPRLGIPPQWETDAGIGVATQGGAKEKRERTALPSGLATAATWDPVAARNAGAMIGAEARASGFNVLLAGGVNLVREPRNGRNFEYAGEDPLLAGVIVGAQIAGIESNHIISTVKHFALNDQETERNSVNVIIDRDQARMSDLLAFQIAIEQSDPGSVMCSYNKVWGDHACESAYLLTGILRRDWGWRGYVMSDWGATHSTAKAANAGLDQQSGYPFDDQPYFGDLLLKAVDNKELDEARLTEMALRIVRTMFAKGVVDHPVEIGPSDFKAHAEVSRAAAEQGAVLLKNEGILPLKADVARIAVIGGHADKGVLAGGGSSLVYPIGGNAVPGIKPTSWPGPVVYYPSSPLRAIQQLAPKSQVQFASGEDRKAAASLASTSDVALVFVTQWNGEGDDKSLTLENGQDALVTAVVSANPRTVVVLETGGAVFMPWIDKVPAALQAWYPGTSGGEAIANLLFGKTNPSGHLPITYPKDESQFARSVLLEKDAGGGGEVRYVEGAAVGYKWMDSKNLRPLFPFGHGLSYTRFKYSDLEARVDGEELVVSFVVSNVGGRDGKDVPQIYLSPAAGGWEAPKRLGGWRKVDLKDGARASVEVRVDPRLLALYSSAQNGWHIAAGNYKISVGGSAADLALETSVALKERSLPTGYKP